MLNIIKILNIIMTEYIKHKQCHNWMLPQPVNKFPKVSMSAKIKRTTRSRWLDFIATRNGSLTTVLAETCI